MIQKQLNIRQHMWLDFLKDYDNTIEYHPREDNVAAHAQFRQLRASLPVCI